MPCGPRRRAGIGSIGSRRTRSGLYTKTSDRRRIARRLSRTGPSPLISMTDWDAERYHRLSNPQLGWGRHVLERLAPEPNECILDLGCGTGRLTSELFAAMGDGLVVAVDRSESMLREAASRHLWHRGPHPVDTDKLPTRLHVVRADGLCAAVRRRLRRGAEYRDVSLDPRSRSTVRQHLPVAGAWRPAGGAVRRCRQPRQHAGARGGAHDRAAVPRPFHRLARSVGVRRRRDHDRAARSRRVHRHRRDARSPRPRASPIARAIATFSPASASASTCSGCRRTCRRDSWTRWRTGAAADDPPYTLDYWRLNILARKPAGIERAA